MSKSNSGARNAVTGEGEVAVSGSERDGNVDKIRDILFGSQMRDYDRKFAMLEERLMKETADFREDVKRRFATLEAFIKGEIEALDAAQKAEKTERTEAEKKAATET